MSISTLYLSDWEDQEEMLAVFFSGRWQVTYKNNDNHLLISSIIQQCVRETNRGKFRTAEW